MKTELNKEEIKNLLPHREPMLLIDKLTEYCSHDICDGSY